MRFLPVLFSGFLLLVLSAIPAFAQDETETAYERVIRTNTLRCGYIEWPGYLEKDAATGKMSGAAYDVAEAIGAELGIKIEWTEAVGWGNYQEGLNTNRYDATCAGLWESGNRIRISLLSRPIFYSGMYAAVRADDTRFDASIDAINQPTINFEIIEGDVTETTKNAIFPNATSVPLAASVDSAQYVLNIALKKADVGLISLDTLNGFNENNPDKKIKLAADGKPVRVFGNSFAIKSGELELKAMIDSTIEALTNDGTLQRIAKVHGAAFIPVVAGYKE